MAKKQSGNNKNKRKNNESDIQKDKWKNRQQYYDDVDFRRRLQEAMYTPDYILKKIFRKDGPPLGFHFDSLPSHAFQGCNKDSRILHCALQENQRALKKQKVSLPVTSEHQFCNENGTPVRKHGKGKALMTVWQATNPGAGDFPPGIDFSERAEFPISSKQPSQKKKIKQQRRQPPVKRFVNKRQVKKKPPLKRQKVACQKAEKQKQPCKKKCELSSQGMRCQEHIDQFASLVDDEELELREQQRGSNPSACSGHFSMDGLHSCSLCKDLLAKFPPNSVMMKQPLYMQPWDSSLDLIKKLFKVFNFIYTYALMIDICSFTIDELAQAFLEKDSLLLGKIQVALLKLLLSEVKTEISSGFSYYASKNCKFLWLIQSVERQEFLLNYWQVSLNPLTWTEIFRQVLVAAGFGSMHGTIPREVLNKEASLMARYGLCPGTLKGELFSLLLVQGNSGMKVSELANYPSIVESSLVATTHELELLITSTLSSDITLFEKISSSAYRLRINFVMKDSENFQSDSEDFGSIDDDSRDSGRHFISDDSECDSGTSSPKTLKPRNSCGNKDKMLTVFNEIDESHPGEPWLLGLIESEYSDLRIEEKLNALAALIDLLSAGSSFRKENQVARLEESIPNVSYHSSGAKIKRSTVKQYNFSMSFGGYIKPMVNNKEYNTMLELQPVDSSISVLKDWSSLKRKDGKEVEDDYFLHPMQSIFLGSDRRYNRYWLFLGPCDVYDPGHKRVYFESSEDGHWEVIDSEEAFCTLLSVLDHRGRREAHLLASLEKLEVSLCQAMSSMPNHVGTRLLTQSDQSELNMSREDSSSAVSDVDNNQCLSEIQIDLAGSTSPMVFETGNKEFQHKETSSCVQAFDAWVWNSFYSELNVVKCGKRSYLDSLTRCERCHDLYWRDDRHCKICHTTFELDFDLEERYTIHAATCRENISNKKFLRAKVLSSQLQSLKATIYAIELIMPEDAFVGAWMKSTHNLWVKRLRRTSTLAELLQVLGDFVNAINEDWFYQGNSILDSNSVLKDIIVSFATMPQTSSAVALWLVKLDAFIAPHLERFHSLKKQALCAKN